MPELVEALAINLRQRPNPLSPTVKMTRDKTEPDRLNVTAGFARQTGPAAG